MLILSEQDVVRKIQQGDCFECQIEDGSFLIKIESYIPTICTAVHAGHKLRSPLESKCLLNKSERFYEEDPYTDQLIQAMPITLIALDSRYEYDLNRPVANCIYTKAWGKTVWQKKLNAKERAISIAKHRVFYRVLDALVKEIESRFGAALVMDVHSYNYLRREEHTPTFNIGSEQINQDRWSSVVNYSLKTLRDVTLPNLPVDAAENQVFWGRGYLIAHINSRFENTLVLPLEIKKIFMDELTGDLYPLVMQSLSQQFKNCLTSISAFFTRRFTHVIKNKKVDVLSEKIDPNLVKVDRSLYQLAKGLETLHYINPINIDSERKQFFKKSNYQPCFRYRQLAIDPYKFREQLYRLPVDTIRDPNIQSLYRDTINGLSEKIALLVNVGKPDFVYESLKYYGEPQQIDEDNACFLLHSGQFIPEEESSISTEILIEHFYEYANRWNMRCKVESNAKLVASAMVSNSRKAVMVAKNLRITPTEAQALIHHELGVHMATTLNASIQKLKIFSLGLPGNTFTQEGLAILNEYQSGNMLLKRLQGLALRVLAVKEMLRQGDFRHTYYYLHEEHHMPPNDAFKLAVRVHRGGGFTKDYLYLSGVSQALTISKQQDIRNLYVGKTGFDYLPIINEMIERQFVSAPVYYPEFLIKPISTHPVLSYLMHCIHQQSKCA